MESNIYRKLAAILETEMTRVKRFNTPLEQVLENLAESLIYEAANIEQSQNNE